VDFNFTEPPSEAEKKKDDNEVLLDAEDLSAGLSEAECRKYLNALARGAAYLLVASTGAGEYLDSEMSPLDILNFKSRMRYALHHLQPLTGEGDKKPHKLLPIYRI
jgi:hypothetical protein